jgi:hypothetical protein
MTTDHFTALLERAHAYAADYLRDQPDRHVGARATRDELLSALQTPLTQRGEDGGAVIDLLAAQGERGAIASGSPRYFGFVIGGTYPVALAADWLTSAWDQNAGIYATSPLSSMVEEVAGRWLLDLLDLPRESEVGFVTGCQMASFTCLAAARHCVLRRVGWDVEADGLCGAPRINVVTSTESHITIDVALRYLGLGTRAMHRVDTDAQGRMRPDRLRQVLAMQSCTCQACRRRRTGGLLGHRRTQVVERALRLRRRHRPPRRRSPCGNDIRRRISDPDRGRGARRRRLGTGILAPRAGRAGLRDVTHAWSQRSGGPGRSMLRQRPKDRRTTRSSSRGGDP